MAQTLLSEQKSTAGSPYMFYIYKNGQWTLNKGYIYRDGAWVKVKKSYVFYDSKILVSSDNNTLRVFLLQRRL